MKLVNIFSLTGNGTRAGHCRGPSFKGHINRKHGQNQTSSELTLSGFLQRRRGQQFVYHYHSSRGPYFSSGWTGYIWRLLSK